MKRKCTLLITHACNLNCVYCYERHKSLDRMDLPTARRIFERETDFVVGSALYDAVDFHFLGGEPLLNFELIRDLCEWAWMQECGVPFHFYVITNGTLLDDTKRAWFESYRARITVDMSIDGIDAVHRINRGCSVHELPIAWVHACWPQARFKMTVSRQTLPFFAESVISLVEQGYDLAATPAMGMRWTQNDAIEYDSQWHILVEHYRSLPVEMVWKQLLKSIDPLFDNNCIQEKCCGTGDSAVTYDTNGASYPCVIFTPMVLDRDVWEALNRVRFDDPAVFADAACQTCFIRNMCKTCYGFNLKERGALAERDKSLCGMYKAEIRAICNFQMDLLRNSAIRLPLSDRETTRLRMAEAGAAGLEKE